MCGIAATFRYDARGPLNRSALARMQDCMAARGPDDEGLWIDETGAVGLAHRRLSILDLSKRGAQPMSLRDGRLTLSYNGEIYNYRSLRRELQQKGYSFRSDTDTEALLYLYAEEGAEMVDDLRGMYAFVLWDSGKKGLFCARDPYGIKPLYYADDGTTFHAASQVRALHKAGDIDTHPSPAGHVGFFLWGHVPEPHTMYRGVKALPAGHSLWVDRDGVQDPREHASISHPLATAGSETPSLSSSSFSGGNGASQASSGAEHPSPDKALREALLDSVRSHLVADVEVGLFLSAGLDSATLTALATELQGNLRTITLGFEAFRGTPEDEVPGAERLADRYGTTHDTVWVSKRDFSGAHDRFFGAMDQPTIDGANTYFVSQAAAEAGLKVALSGVGGDELFGGYPSFHQIPRLVSLLQPVPGAATLGRGLRAVSAPVVRRFTSPKYAGLLEYGSSFAGAYLLRRGLYMPWELPQVLDPDFAAAGWDALQPLARLEATADPVPDPRLKVSALESAWYMRNQLLRDTDWASMAHSLEVRTPLVDWTLLQELAPLLAQNHLSKKDMARTPQRALPEDLLSRPKTGFTVPLRQWLLADRPEYDQARGLRGWAQYVYDRYTEA